MSFISVVFFSFLLSPRFCPAAAAWHILCYSIISFSFSFWFQRIRFSHSPAKKKKLRIEIVQIFPPLNSSENDDWHPIEWCVARYAAYACHSHREINLCVRQMRREGQRDPNNGLRMPLYSASTHFRFYSRWVFHLGTHKRAYVMKGISKIFL